MKFLFLVRARQHPGTALHNAAEMDARHLAKQGHKVTVACIEGVLPPHFKWEDLAAYCHWIKIFKDDGKDEDTVVTKLLK